MTTDPHHWPHLSLSSCTGCGELRSVVHREPHAVVWSCPTCGLSRESEIRPSAKEQR